MRNEQDIRELVTRASDIDRELSELLQSDEEVSMAVNAAEEAGISRAATLQALRERLSAEQPKLEKGQRVFARSNDGHYYVAMVDEPTSGGARLRFANGSFGEVGAADMRPMALLPGTTVEVGQPWGWAKAEVTGFQEVTQTVNVRFWGSIQSYTLDKVRLKTGKGFSWTDQLQLKMLITFGAGSAVGALLTLLFSSL
jgi:hypothetical protein